MVRGKDLIIAFGNDLGNWDWRLDDDSREVAELCSSWMLDIGAEMGAGVLKARSVYAAYLVYKLRETAEGLEKVKGIIRFVDDKSDMEGAGERVVHLHPGWRWRLDSSTLEEKTEQWRRGCWRPRDGNVGLLFKALRSALVLPIHKHLFFLLNSSPLQCGRRYTS
ncbi:hypothetical protein SASPL_109332 [Salvia splendens]|uniref:Uncharacterized protein n=1 Tax=Salvia splendens TaxID=180675 RepID=A0A8X8YGC2_SALSN|nr:uncharacterized protein LOC121797005 [Salvia splendens]KAG6431254.1 hypothetical protein SASPL_109332 [Salvia splendens]